jgi:Tetratricopeptide repeat
MVSRLAAAAGGGRVAVVCAVTGLRGVGKTQVAAAYARARVGEGCGLVGWVNAETRDVLLDGLRRVAEALGVADPEGDSLESARRLRAYLQTRAGEGLLVFDNATDPDGLRPFLPATGGTQVVVTTTDRAFAELGEPVDVSAFTRPQSVGYLRARTGLADEDGADAVAQELGDLPLGLAQAAATIGSQHLTYSRYLERLRRVPVRELLGRSPGEDYPHATAAALLLSVQATEVSDPTGLAGWLLRVLAALSPEGIPRGLLDGLPRVRRGRRLAVFRRRGSRRLELEMDAAIGRCAAGSLLDWSVTGDAVIMHRLLARVLRERDQARGQWVRTVAAALNLLEPLLFSETEAWSRREEGARLGAQVEALWDADAGVGTGDRDLALRQLRARSWAVRQLRASADLSRAIATGIRTLADSERVLGADHPDTLGSRNNLAYAYQDAGDLGRAIPLYERTLADSERVLGADHPDTLTSRNNLERARIEGNSD